MQTPSSTVEVTRTIFSVRGRRDERSKPVRKCGSRNASSYRACKLSIPASLGYPAWDDQLETSIHCVTCKESIGSKSRVQRYSLNHFPQACLPLFVVKV